MPNNTGTTSSNNPVELQRGAAPGIASESSPLDPKYQDLLRNLSQSLPSKENLSIGQDEPGLGKSTEIQNPLAQALQNIHREDDSFLETEETNQTIQDQEKLTQTRFELAKLTEEAAELGLPEEQRVSTSKELLYPSTSNTYIRDFLAALKNSRIFFIKTHESNSWAEMHAGKKPHELTKEIQDRLFGNEQNINQGQ